MDRPDHVPAADHRVAVRLRLHPRARDRDHRPRRRSSGSGSSGSRRSCAPTSSGSPGSATTRSRSSRTPRRPFAGAAVAGRLAGGGAERRRRRATRSRSRPCRSRSGGSASAIAAPNGPPGHDRRHRADRSTATSVAASRSSRSPAALAWSRIPTPNMTWFIVIEGGGWVGVGDEHTRVAAGEAVLWPADIPHAAWTEHSEMRAFVVEFADADDAAMKGILEGRARELTAGTVGQGRWGVARRSGRARCPTTRTPASRPERGVRSSATPRPVALLSRPSRPVRSSRSRNPWTSSVGGQARTPRGRRRRRRSTRSRRSVHGLPRRTSAVAATIASNRK